MDKNEENGITYQCYDDEGVSYERTFVDAGHPRFQAKYYCPGCKKNFSKNPKSVIHHFESKVHEEKLPKCLKCKEAVFEYKDDRRKKVFQYCGCFSTEMTPVVDIIQKNGVPGVKAEKRKIDPLSEPQIVTLDHFAEEETAEVLNLSPKKQRTDEDVVEIKDSEA